MDVYRNTKCGLLYVVDWKVCEASVSSHQICNADGLSKIIDNTMIFNHYTPVFIYLISLKFGSQNSSDVFNLCCSIFSVGNSTKQEFETAA